MGLKEEVLTVHQNVNKMTVKDYNYWAKVHKWTSFALFIITWIALFWWIDANWQIPQSWNTWLDELFFLLELVIVIAWLLIFVALARGWAWVLAKFVGFILRKKLK